MWHRWVVTVDGACINNGRYGASAGYGVFWGNNDPRNDSGPVSGEQKSGRAELTAVREAMQIGLNDGLRQLRIRTDSEYVRNSLDVWIHTWKYNGWRTSRGEPVENADLIREIDSLRGAFFQGVEFVHVPGHSGDYCNEQADRMAKLAALHYFVI